MSNQNNNSVSTNNGKEYKPYQWFFTSEVLSSLLLLLASVSAIIIANSYLGPAYEHWVHYDVSILFGKFKISHSLLHWINDGLMSLFFLTVGLEIKREVLVGELATPKMALLPAFAAVGGMIVPGMIYMAFNFGTPGAQGWGIPVATDIAFALGAIALLGRRLPVSLRVFLTAFAIADDMGAVMIIALFYTKSIAPGYLIAGGVCLIILLIANRLFIRWIPFYIVLGMATWICAMGSGVHATIAGVAVAMLIPARGKYNTAFFRKKAKAILENMEHNQGIDHYWYSIFIKPQQLDKIHALEIACHDVETPLQRIEHALHPWVVFGILPLFAFFNAGLNLEGMSISHTLMHPITMGCLLGLLIGKPLGVTAFSFLAVRTGLASLPEKVQWSHILGAGMLGGIGFTMSLFISGLSFAEITYHNYSKLGVLSGSALSAIFGLSFLFIVSGKQGKAVQED